MKDEELYEVYIYNEDKEVVGQTVTTEKRVALCAANDAQFVTKIHDGWTSQINGFDKNE
jgi:hypothetical protein